MNKLVRWTIIISIISLPAVRSGLAQTDTTFTYQGELRQGGVPAAGAYNIDFALWDAVSGGNQVGAAIMFNSLPVSDGLFTVDLDFGPAAFDGSARWLEVTVNGSELSPRTPLNPAPYSIQTRGMAIAGNGNVLFNSLAAVEGLMTVSSIGGIDLILDADTNNAGEDQNARLVLRQDGGQVVGRMGYREGANKLELMQEYSDSLIFGTNNQDRLTIGPSGFVGVGRANPITIGEIFGLSINTISFGGMCVETADNGEPFYGYSSGGDLDAYTYYSQAAEEWRVNVLGNNLLRVGYDTLVGPYAIVHVNGLFSKSAGSFKIDHPLDPANKYLSHSFVESPDMMNIYNGNVITDGDGRAVVTMPDWFEALNRDFRYQLTVIDDDEDSFVLVKILREMQDGAFTIKSSEPRTKVSWQMTGIRDDAFARMHPIVVEQDKAAEDRGYYLTPEAFGRSSDEAIGSQRAPEQATAAPSSHSRDAASEAATPTRGDLQ